MKRVEVSGQALEYFELPGSPAIVFLHEGLGSAAQWRDFPQRLASATGCGALVYSRAGYGGSDPVSLPRPLTYMHDEGERVLPALLEALRARDAILFGHSDGGSIALVAAGSGRARGVRAVITEAAHVFCEDLSVQSIAAARDAYQGSDLREKLRKWHGDNVDCAFLGWNGAWLDPGFRQWNLERYLPGVRVPALVLQGKQDPYGTAAQVEAIARGLGGPVEAHLIDDCGHAPHKEQPERTLALCSAFIRRILTP